MKTTILSMLAGISALALVGCSEEQTIVQAPEEPAATEERTNDTMRELREGAGALSREAGRLAGEARDRAREALDDAGPTLDRAGEIARDIGASVGEIMRRAAEDLETGARMLEERIAQSDRSRDVTPTDPDAMLAPADTLRADTRAAARALEAGVGPEYVGVWAGDPASCARIDREAVEMMAVITPTTLRRHESVCNIEAAPLSDGTATVSASCMAEGDSEERQITFAMDGLDRLNIAYDGAVGGADLVRCHLPE